MCVFVCVDVCRSQLIVKISTQISISSKTADNIKTAHNRPIELHVTSSTSSSSSPSNIILAQGKNQKNKNKIKKKFQVGLGVFLSYFRINFLLLGFSSTSSLNLLNLNRLSPHLLLATQHPTRPISHFPWQSCNI